MLCGIPFAIKDNILIKGKTASSASKILEHYKATYYATAVSRLAKEGAIFLGRTNMDEFAMGGSTENSAYGPTKNPRDLSRVPGGTSGGSAAAVAANMALVALGSDTGGSIRQPSSFCGVVGLKPTYGAVSRYGLMAAVSSFDQIGPIANTVEDAEIVFNVIHGKDAKDGTTLENSKSQNPISKTGKNLSAGRHGKPVIGIPRAFMSLGGIDPAVKEAFEAAEKKFKDLGYEIKDIELPANKYALSVYYILNFAEVSSNMARYDGVKYGLHVDGKDGIDDYGKTRRAGLGREVIRRILLGTYVLSSGYYDAYYNRANAVRRMITDDFKKAFEGVDLIATPTTPGPAFKIGEKASDPMAMYLEDIFTVTANLTGLPAISIPCGYKEMQISKEAKTEKTAQLPLGLQLTARHGDEKTLFEAGKDFLGELE
jgi:aspartyl-tRNA(Asn)/glutamyl-tRNA(Gln) amidotransferase subunit A